MLQQADIEVGHSSSCSRRASLSVAPNLTKLVAKWQMTSSLLTHCCSTCRRSEIMTASTKACKRLKLHGGFTAGDVVLSVGPFETPGTSCRHWVAQLHSHSRTACDAEAEHACATSMQHQGDSTRVLVCQASLPPPTSMIRHLSCGQVSQHEHHHHAVGKQAVCGLQRLQLLVQLWICSTQQH